MRKILNKFIDLFYNLKACRAIMVVEFVVIIVLAVALAVSSATPNPVVSLPTTAEVESADLSDTDSSDGSSEDHTGEFLFNDATLGELWLPIAENLSPSTIDPNGFEDDENGLRYYVEDGERTSICGIDISYYQGYIDWEKVKEQGIEFVFIRVGYRGYETGSLNLDERFYEYIEDANNAGIDVGVYFFSQATTPEEAVEEAEFVLGHIEDYKVSYPVVFDWEPIGEPTARTKNISTQMLTDCTKAFCERVKEAGYMPMIYTSRSIAYLRVNLEELAEYPLWIADFNDKPSFYYDYAIWQYSYKGIIDGIDHPVDLNVCFKDFSSDGDF